MALFGQVEIETRYRRMEKNQYIDFIGTYAAAYRKDIFQEYNGFDTGFPLASGEDTEFSYKLYENNHKMVFAPEAFVFHQHPSRIKEYLKSKFYRGYWRIRLYRKHPAKTMNDSYTPQTLKVQVLSIPFLILFALLSGVSLLWLFPLMLIAVSFIYFSIPFFKLFNKKGYYKKSFIPLVLFFRASAIFFGLLFGTLNEVIKRR